MREKGAYIVVEGQDATGKSTQVELLADYFCSHGQETVTFDEPAGLPSTDEMRATILNKDNDLDPVTCVLMYTSARRELWLKKARPALGSGAIVLAARNWWSTLAYQGYGQGVNLNLIEETTKKYLPPDYVKPDFAVMLLLDDAERHRRMYGRDDSHEMDTFESKGVEFQERVNQGYAKIAKEFDVKSLDASPSESVIRDRIIELLPQNWRVD